MVYQWGTMTDKTNYEQALREIVQGGQDMARLAGEPEATSEAWPAKLARLQSLSRMIRTVSDACGRAEDIYKAEAPPHCDIRVRREHRLARCKPGLIEARTLTNPGWLSLAATNGHVLEILMLDDEWPHETAARFARACSTSPEEHLAAALAEKAGE